MNETCDPARRRVLRAMGLAVALPVLGAAAPALAAPTRRLDFGHLHTGERLSVTYFRGGAYDADALDRIDGFLRDFRTGEVAVIDRDLLDTLYLVRQRLGAGGRFEVISGYRSPQTNAMLRQRSSGVAKRSLHMEGRAIDVRLTGVDTAGLRDAAIALQAGGVGYYRRSDFVHLDTGRVRAW